MTTRRGRSSGSGQPGTQAWRRRVEEIKRELEGRNRRLLRILEEQDGERGEEVQPLFDLAESLRAQELLSYMNDTLLDGQGVIQTILLWDESQVLEDEEDEDWDDEDDDDDDDDEEDWDDEDEDYELSASLTVMLSWKAAGRLQIRVEIQDFDGEIEVQVNGNPVEPRSASKLQSVLIEVFREQMDENYGNFDEEDDE